MIHREGQFASEDGLNLYYQYWGPSQEPPQPDNRAIIAIAHGSGEHSGRYSNVVNYFSKKGYPLYGFDFRGHGKSEGRISHVMNWQEYRADLDGFLRLVASQNPGAPLFLYGHSMGAQIALDYLTHNDHVPLAGVIASAPAISAPPASGLLKLVAKLISAIFPGFRLDNGLDVNFISRDPEVVGAYTNDPLVSSKITARFGAQFLSCIERVQSRAENIDVPLFMFHGDADQIIPMQGTLEFYNKINFADKKLKIYPGGFHEPHNDLQRREVFQDIEQWLDEHTK